MAWFCKRCVDDGVIDKEWLEADALGIVFHDLADDQLIIEICEGCGPGAFDKYGYPADCEEGCEVDPEYRIQELTQSNESLKASFMTLQKEIKRYEEIEKTYAISEDSLLQEVKEIFDDILHDRPRPSNTRLTALIEGYVRKLNNKHQNETININRSSER
jgi:hypothetical protein